VHADWAARAWSRPSAIATAPCWSGPPPMRTIDGPGKLLRNHRTWTSIGRLCNVWTLEVDSTRRRAIRVSRRRRQPTSVPV
jgi:hypothetical protein